MTAEDFDAFTLLPENSERLFEFVGGEIVEVPSNPYSSAVAAKFLIALGIFLQGKNLGHLTGEAGGYIVSGERYAPDVAFISKARQPELARSGYNPNPPDRAVEVVSPTDSEKLLRIKLANYLAAGTVVWVAYPQSKEVEVYAPGEPVKILDETQTLDGGKVLPGFKLRIADLFQTD
jgi:Uma2 family endonuclease